MNRMWIAGMVAALVAGAGCGQKAQEKATEKLIERSLAAEGVDAQVDIAGDTMSFTATGADGKKSNVRIAGDQMTIVGEDGTTSFRAGGAGPLPPEFPQDVLAYPGAAVVSSLTAPGSVNVALQSADSAADVAAKYQAEMAANGWTAQSSFAQDGMSMLTFAKEDRTANVVIQAQDGGAQINVTIATEPRD
jgi:hypothetical protein